MLRTSATTEAQSLTAFHGHLNKRVENSYKNDKYLHIGFGFFNVYSLQGRLRWPLARGGILKEGRCILGGKLNQSAQTYILRGLIQHEWII